MNLNYDTTVGKLREHSDHEIFDAFLTYFSDYTKHQLSTDHRKMIRDAFKLKKISKRQFLLREGEVCKYISYVVSGALRTYSINERGQESIIVFALEGEWVSDWESVNLKTPGNYYIDAIEDSVVLQISPAELLSLAEKIPAIDQFMHLEHGAITITTQKRIHSAISMSAEERYHELLKSHPQYFRRFSQNMIASYLGIKPETLSRLRRR